MEVLNIMKYKELIHNIIGCAMKVHSELGNGFYDFYDGYKISLFFAFSPVFGSCFREDALYKFKM